MILNHFLNLGQLIDDYISSHDMFGVLGLFYVSESILGWIPPDLFIMWSEQFNNPLLWLTILGTISYFGGINAYFLGKLALKYPRLKQWLEKKNEIFFVLFLSKIFFVLVK